VLARAARAEFRPVHIASEAIARELPDEGPGLVGDKAHSVIFDNAKVKSLVPEYRAVIPSGAALRRSWTGTTPTPRVARSTPNSMRPSTG
jgi:hypothetical protein